jgi:hypothetical protein
MVGLEWVSPRHAQQTIWPRDRLPHIDLHAARFDTARHDERRHVPERHALDLARGTPYARDDTA